MWGLPASPELTSSWVQGQEGVENNGRIPREEPSASHWLRLVTCLLLHLSLCLRQCSVVIGRAESHPASRTDLRNGGSLKIMWENRTPPKVSWLFSMKVPVFPVNLGAKTVVGCGSLN